MTPEEREKFLEAMRARCGHFDPPSAERPTAWNGRPRAGVAI